ncbi:MAG: thiamine ABC transporter substrate-binding protein [Anaerolineae bacterium]|nr:thiamine ABC transporter substrate-binding protein [Anaerolineae bacterium]
MKKWGIVVTVILLGVLGAACGAEETATPETGLGVVETPGAAVDTVVPEAETEGDKVLTVMTHDSFDVSQEVIALFVEACDCEVQFLQSGDTGLMLNQALLSRGNPVADVIYGVDNTFLSRALAGDILEAYPSPLLAEIPDDLELDPTHHMLPVDYGDVCLNYDKAWFEKAGLAPPSGLEDLTEPAYEGLTVVENPATSSPGLSFLLATIGRFGQAGEYTYLDYWADLRANGVLVTDGWEDAYYGSFTYASDGDRPIVVSYASSPPVEVFFAAEPFDEAPTGVVTGDQSCFRQVEFVGILAGTANRDLAEQWIDFMLSEPFQEDIPLKMFVFPANENAALPEVFVEFSTVPENPVFVDIDAIEEKREEWIQAWVQTVLR